MFKLDKKGSVVVTVALSMPLVIGGVAFGVEAGFWRYDQVRLQQAADAAAYNGGLGAREGVSNITTAATGAAAANGYTTTTDTIQINTPSTATPADANSVEAILVRTEPTLFAYYITHKVVTLKARATASYINASDACVLALDPSAQEAVYMSGNSQLTLSGCAIMSDSVASNSFTTDTSTATTAPCIYTVGGKSVAGSVSLTTCSAVKTSQPPIGNPYKSINVPTGSFPACGLKTSTPDANGFYWQHVCTKNWTPPNALNNTMVWLDGSTSNASMKIAANQTYTGTGDTFFLSGSASVSMTGSTTVTWSAPTSGPYSGFLFVGGDGPGPGNTTLTDTAGLTINGTNTSSLTGIIYMPDAKVTYTGNFSGANGCTQVVADLVEWQGNAGLKDNCTNAGMGAVRVGSVVKLTS